MGKINCIKAYWSAYFSTIIKCCETYKIKEPEFQVIWSILEDAIIVVKTSITLSFKLHMPGEPVFNFSLYFLLFIVIIWVRTKVCININVNYSLCGQVVLSENYSLKTFIELWWISM